METEKIMKYCPYCMNPVEEGKPCGVCNLTLGSYAPAPHHLPPQTVLMDRYVVGRVLGEGGFGITYIGCDLKLELKVAIKEYFPSDKATRHSQVSLEVSRYTGSAAEAYEKGMEKFLNEARAMAAMDKQTEIVGVRDYFEANGSAYIVMEYVEGTTLKKLVEQRGGRIGAGELLHMMEPLFFALEAMHEKGLIHRDISPDNLMLENGSVCLLDFGCARESLNGEETMTIALKHGYAPIEQYQHKGQGPWTDVYGLCATLYYCLTGKVPPQALDRLCEDELVLPRKLGVDLTENQERALLYGMEIRPKHRCQSMRELYAALYTGVFAPPARQKRAGLAAELEELEGAQPAPAAGVQPSQNADMPAAEVQFALETGKQPEGQVPPADVPEHAADIVAKSLHARLQDRLREKNITRKQFIGAASLFSALVLTVMLAVMLGQSRGAFAPEPGGSQVGDGAGMEQSKPDMDVGSEAIFGELPELPADLFDGAATVTEASEKSLKDAILGDGGSVTWDGAGRIELTGSPLVLTKPLRIGRDAELELAAYLTVSDGGILLVEGGLENNGLLHIEGSGLVLVAKGGVLTGVSCVWMEREENFIVSKGGNAVLFGNSFAEVGYDDLWFMVLDEKEAFADAVHVASLEELIEAKDKAYVHAIVIDGDMTLEQQENDDVAFLIYKDLLIAEGVTVTTTKNASLHVYADKTINRGTIQGSVDIGSSFSGAGSANFINYGTITHDTTLSDDGNAINFGQMGANDTSIGKMDGSVRNLCNVGTISHTGRRIEYHQGRDGSFLFFGNREVINLGVIQLDESEYEGNSFCYMQFSAGTLVYNHGEIVLDGGELRNYTDFRGYGSITAKRGILGNYGQIRLSSAPSAGRGGSLSVTREVECRNLGAVYYSEYSDLDLPFAPEKFDGAMLAFDPEVVDVAAAYVTDGTQLQEALADASCARVIVAEDIVLETGITVEKTLGILPGKTLTFAGSGLTVRGKGNVCGGTLLLCGRELSVTDDASVCVDNLMDCGALSVLRSGTLLLSQDGEAFVPGAVLTLASGGRVCDFGDRRLAGVELSIGENSLWYSTKNLALAQSSVAIAAGGSLGTDSSLLRMDADSRITNRGNLELYSPPSDAKWVRHIIEGVIVNYAWLATGCVVQWDGMLLNYGEAHFSWGDRSCGSGTIDNQGMIFTVQRELEDGKVFEADDLLADFTGTYKGAPVEVR